MNASRLGGITNRILCAFTVTMATDINKTVAQAKWNIKNEDQLVDLWQQHRCCLMQDILQQG